MNARHILSASAVALTLSVLTALPLSAQKKPLDHSVYDTWQTVSSIQNPYGGNWLLLHNTQRQRSRHLPGRHQGRVHDRGSEPGHTAG